MLFLQSHCHCCCGPKGLLCATAWKWPCRVQAHADWLQPADAQVYRIDSGKDSGPPAFVHAADYHLVFRLNGRSPVTMWEPVPPEGYAALGTLVEGAPQMPDPAEILCIRKDLTDATGTFDAPIWRWDPPALQVIPRPHPSHPYLAPPDFICITPTCWQC